MVAFDYGDNWILYYHQFYGPRSYITQKEKTFSLTGKAAFFEPEILHRVKIYNKVSNPFYLR
jgi:hypothetical protein